MRYDLITIEGVIGSGKTSLAKKVAAAYNAKLILEEFDDNPFLPRFYEEKERFAFPLELFFMAERYQQLKSRLPERELFQEKVVTDYMFTKSLIFAKVTLNEEEFKLYNRLFSIINPTLPEPDMILYLYASTERLINNIRKRGRDYELKIQEEYLQQLNQTYMDYFRQRPHLKILVLNVTGIDFLKDDIYFQKILGLLEKEHQPGMKFIDLEEEG